MLIAGNWKMFKGPEAAAEFCRALREVELPDGVDVAVCPPYVSLETAVRELAGTEVAVCAQSVHWEAEGAFTGEVSAPMLQELGVYGAIVGHSERRQYFGETDETVAKRVTAALEAGLWVIACVGETEAQREAGETEDVLRRQVSVLDAHALIHSLLAVPVLYGGSVKPDNAAELMWQPDVDGALVGGASLEVDSFVAICRAAASA
ncbi:MAG TPA: triose-phosphate isomerase [Gaiellaceae bacterium]|nr:triose-phosphate isomerase [Gaiellaceae bacterium]